MVVRRLICTIVIVFSSHQSSCHCCAAAGRGRLPIPKKNHERRPTKTMKRRSRRRAAADEHHSLHLASTNRDRCGVTHRPTAESFFRIYKRTTRNHLLWSLRRHPPR